ncbi:hydrogenase maturation nickel metallochaperone HypA [candidate division KSB1 bacterium]|nr:MAG: hydrogenase maturation nickel metallochaperone HypA [candidate division KSB1 bacterium]MBC6950616.1 hydrogenase maturation nickel metallochaperone HypA [candidate division KSB1 bacterium]MCE7940797.1 hydrogenase maturation nickel metallochaperone HypA [Chlorobi bacterium CHB1]MDL1874183.1 hydrogenase maturation nickel metallochaperone HypA [Cytophagia bacterium CHB2]
MHEFSLMADLMRKIESVARVPHARRVLGVKVKLGALSHMSPDHFREHFVHASRGTIAENAHLDIEVSNDFTDSHAQEIILESVEVDEFD